MMRGMANSMRDVVEGYSLESYEDVAAKMSTADLLSDLVRCGMKQATTEGMYQLRWEWAAEAVAEELAKRIDRAGAV